MNSSHSLSDLLGQNKHLFYEKGDLRIERIWLLPIVFTQLIVLIQKKFTIRSLM